MTRIEEYIKYHEHSARIGDIDPSYAMLRYVCDRFELNEEQRYWLAFVYALCYCGATTYYIYSELPDFENLDRGRMERWWKGAGREASIFQTDSRWRRSRNQVVDAIECYRSWVGPRTQAEFFASVARGDTPERRYDSLLRRAKELYTFGQFSLFLYLEALHTITPLDLCPTDLDLSQAWSCRDGLCYAYGMDEFICDKAVPTPWEGRGPIAESWLNLKKRLAALPVPPTIWQTETVLCAYRKYQRTLSGQAGATGKRYIGYYLDRQADEIAKMEDHVRDGVSWRVLWEYRRETYDHAFLAEEYGHTSPDGVSKQWKEFGIQRTKELLA